MQQQEGENITLFNGEVIRGSSLYISDTDKLSKEVSLGRSTSRGSHYNNSPSRPPNLGLIQILNGLGGADLRECVMPNIKFFTRCVGESPPVYGSRKAYSCVPPGHPGQCCLHYELDGQSYVAAFESYQQALTAATIAIFSDDHDFQHVFIRASTGKERCQCFANAQVWLEKQV